MAGDRKLPIRINIPKVKLPDLRKSLRIAFLGGILFSALVLGAFFGAYRAILKNLPSISELEKFEPGVITSLYADNGEVTGEYAIQKRIQVRYEDIPDVLKKAIIATEDPRFFKHKGIDFWGILRAVKEDLKIIFKPRRLHGGSTISQQLARELFLHKRQQVRRKLKEIILALQIEKNYSKEQILTMYCNQFYLNHGAYGVEAASQLYFGKHVSDLNPVEAAMIAGILRGPSLYSPYNTPDLTFRRRNHVLNRMAEEGYISSEEGEAAKKEPLGVLPLNREDSEFAAYFNEEVRKYLEQTYGEDALYRGGLRVYTTLDPKLQKFAEESLIKGLRELDRRQGWRKDKINLLALGVENLEALEEPFKTDSRSDQTYLATWKLPDLEVEKTVEAVVLSVERSLARVKIKDYTGTLTNKDIGWTQTSNLRNLIRRGDIIQVKIQKIDPEKKELQILLDQEPLVEGAFLAIHPQTGQIKAMVGGYSFGRLKFNQATQALRQAGSAIKPFLYTAALDNGYTPATTLVDEPTVFVDKWSDKTWAPPNYDQKYKGRVTLRIGLEESRNVVTAKLLEYISPQMGVEYCRKFGLTTPLYPYPSLALGTPEVKLVELVSAYSVFPNRGVRSKPYFITRIEDKDGNILEENKIEAEEVTSPQVAYIMTSLLQGVIQRGTAKAASFLEADKPLAGKTGTTDEFTDAWFIGFSPSLCAGVWVGHQTKVTLGPRQSGAVAALPIWIDFSQKVIDEEKRLASERGEVPLKEEFSLPPYLEFYDVDYKTGQLATRICRWIIKEVFLPGTHPDRFCTLEDHLMVRDYYNSFQEKEEH